MNNAAQVKQVQGAFSGSSQNYASNVLYEVNGASKQLTLGNGLVETATFNQERLQPVSITAQVGTTTFWSSQYGYCAGGVGACSGNNGNVLQQTITRPAGIWTQTYSYDSLDRLVSASEAGTGAWAEGYAYDAFGNRGVAARGRDCRA